MNKSRRVLIIGGGIAGPTLSMFLRRAGIDVEVFEAYPRAENVGGGFQIAPNGMRVFEALGLAPAIAAEGSAAGEFTFLNHQGRVIGRMRPDRAGKAITTMRAPLYRVLLDAVAGSGISIQYGKRLREISHRQGQVIAHFEDGTTAHGDLLVGADGVHSRVRALIAPEHARPRYTGMLGIGGLAGSGVQIPDDAARSRSLNFVLGPRLSFGYARMNARERRWGWWCHLPQQAEPARSDLQAIPTETLRRQVADAFAGWCDPVGPCIASTETIVRTGIYEVPPLPSWSRGPVVLIGDAAHAMSPAAGQGASLALEDAMLLAQLLGDGARPLDRAFADFERRRRGRVRSIAAAARSNDERSLKPLGAFGCWMRDRLFPLLAPLLARGLEKQYAASIPQDRHMMAP